MAFNSADPRYVRFRYNHRDALLSIQSLRLYPTREARLHARGARCGMQCCHSYVHGVGKHDADESEFASRARLTIDPNSQNPLHQDIPTANTTSYLSTRIDPRIASRRLSPITAPLPLSTTRSNASTSASLPPGESNPSTTARVRLLRWDSSGLRRDSRFLDPLVSRLARSVSLGVMVDVRREEALVTTGIVSVLGPPGCYQCRGLEQTAQQSTATSSICSPRCTGGAGRFDRCGQSDDGCGRPTIADSERQCEEEILPCVGGGHVCSWYRCRCEWIHEDQADVSLHLRIFPSPLPSPLSTLPSISGTSPFGHWALAFISSSTSFSIIRILGQRFLAIFTSLRVVDRQYGLRGG